MNTLAALAFAFAVGLTLAGLAGSVLEIVHAKRLTMAAPFVERDRIVRALGFSLLAGAFMLVNDAFAAWRSGMIRVPALGLCLALGFVWLLATGILVTELALVVRDVLQAAI